jgi:hypothetical protein
MDIKRKEQAIREAYRLGFCSSQCPENELDDDLGWGLLTGVEWADEHPKKNLVEIEKAWNWFNTKVLRILPKSIREKIKESFYEKMQENF